MFGLLCTCYLNVFTDGILVTCPDDKVSRFSYMHRVPLHENNIITTQEYFLYAYEYEL
jgi:hypothetical protein